VKVLGEDLVLFPGKDGKVAALMDRCPHRGTMLSRGRVLFPGTVSCGYHGWTFNESGDCVAAIVEGP
ncbi:MAG: Rieske 2Fe-2S domain-containing protein, partial [Deltaproteobacteria bacterium]|nr:Rieske 2Fe-2S domain-containing protein [Deltaproteobacteria bacterium]